jgi:Do/DeqQ family serine protease
MLVPGLGKAQEAQIPASREQIQLSFAPVVKKIAPTVVNIYTKRTVTRAAQNPFMNDPLFAELFGNSPFGGRMKKQVENTLGSGVIVQPDGLVVTNAHVTQDALEITVVLSDGREFDGKVVLKDAPSDLALVRIDTKGEQLPYASLKPSESMNVGDLVLAIGNPFGVGQTVTSGIVSALARSSLGINDFNFFIQTDAAINPGNSGGPLIALDGGVVGINSAIYSKDGSSLGIGFAIPSEMVASVIAAEKAGSGAGDRIARPWLGVTTQNITAEIASSLGMARPQGVLVTALHSASPMLKAGIQVGDALVSINGHQIHDSAEAKFRMATVPLGGAAKFEISRKGQMQSFDVNAVAPPDVPAREESSLSGNHPLNGATIVNINPAVNVELGGMADEKGVVILSTEPGTYASRLLRNGDILLEINDVKILKVADVKAALKKEGAGWVLSIKRQGHVTRVVIR